MYSQETKIADPEYYYKDTGCDVVERILDKRFKCQLCPFKDCIESLKPREVDLIVQAEIIRSVIKFHKAGYEYDILYKIFHWIPQETIRRWIRSKDKIIRKLNKFAIVV
jgi:hypothetical protein